MATTLHPQWGKSQHHQQTSVDPTLQTRRRPGAFHLTFAAQTAVANALARRGRRLTSLVDVGMGLAASFGWDFQMDFGVNCPGSCETSHS